MRVLAVTHSLAPNGAAWCLAYLLVAVKAAGGTADVVYSGNELLVPYLKEHGIGIIDQAQTAQYDVAVVNTLIDHARVLQLAPALPVVFWVHEGVLTRDNMLGSAPAWMQAFRASSRLVFDSPSQPEQVYQSFLDGVAAHRIQVVATAPKVPSDAATLPQRSYVGKRIVSVGSVYPRKRPADLVAAVLRMGDAQAHCTLVGSTEHLALNGPDMQAALQSNAGQFRLVGEVSDTQVIQQLLEADVFCSASGDESFGMAQVQAASVGLPLALSDLPCYHGIWQHGVNALLAPVGAVDVLSWNLLALTSDPALAQRLGQAAQKTAARFSQQRFLRAMSDVLVQAIEDPAQQTLRT